ncbi:MAG TPA: DUF4416 family protein [Syntrophales bacterium]|nr:DUF4416 family protein [Syntrophales bacterium]
MSRLKPAEPVKAVASLIFREMAIMEAAIGAMASLWGEPDYISRVFPFHYTDYYRREMGSDLMRRFFSFGPLMPPETLPDRKIKADLLEADFAVSGNRRVNIDPGYVSNHHLILATGKAFAHRPYLRDGVYADLTLIFREGGFQPLPWTYPDYGSEEVRGVFFSIRQKYRKQLRMMST